MIGKIYVNALIELCLSTNTQDRIHEQSIAIDSIHRNYGNLSIHLIIERSLATTVSTFNLKSHRTNILVIHTMTMNHEGFISPLRNSGTLGRDLQHNISPYEPKTNRRQRTGGGSGSRRLNSRKSTINTLQDFRGMTLDSIDNHRDQPTPYVETPRDDVATEHLNDNETGFLPIGSQAATHQYDVEGTWKMLYTKKGNEDGGETSDSSSSSLGASAECKK